MSRNLGLYKYLWPGSVVLSSADKFEFCTNVFIIFLKVRKYQIISHISKPIDDRNMKFIALCILMIAMWYHQIETMLSHQQIRWEKSIPVILIRIIGNKNS